MHRRTQTPSSDQDPCAQNHRGVDEARSGEAEAEAVSRFLAPASEAEQAEATSHSHFESRRGPPPLPRMRATTDPALSPVERHVVVSLPPRMPSRWLGWATAAGLVVCGGAHYLLQDRPQQQQRVHEELARTQQEAAHAAQLAQIASDLERTRAELDNANANIAAQHAAIAEATAAAEQAVEAREDEAADTKSTSRRVARRGHPAHPGTASSKERSAKGRSRTGTTVSKTRDSSQPLRGVLSSSNDPLEGL